MNILEDKHTELTLLKNQHESTLSYIKPIHLKNKSCFGTKYSKKCIGLMVTIVSMTSFLLITITSLLTLTLSKSFNCSLNKASNFEPSFANLNKNYIENFKNKKEINLKTCESHSCYESTKFMLEHLNRSIDPCFNFHEFSCGNWIKNSPNERDQFTITIDNSINHLSFILSEPYIKEKDSKIVKSFKKYYETCLNHTDIELNGDLQFLQLMNIEFDNWPLVPFNNYKNDLNTILNFKQAEFSKSKFGFEEHLAKLNIYKTPIIFRFDVDSLSGYVYLMRTLTPADFCKLQLFFAKLNEEKARNEFKVFMKNLRHYMIKALNKSVKYEEENLENFEEQIEDMISLGQRIYLINNSNFQCKPRSVSNYLTTIEKLHAKINENGETLFDLKKFVNYLNENSEFKLKNDTHVITSDFFIDYLKAVLKDFNSTRDRYPFLNLIYFESLRNILNLVNRFSSPHIHPIFPIKYYQLIFDFEHYSVIFTDFDTQKNFKKMFLYNSEFNCGHSVIESFFSIGSVEMFELQRFYLSRSKNFSLIKSFAYQMLNNLTQTALETIDEQKWIDNEIKLDIKTKFNEMIVKIAFSDLLDKKLNNLDLDLSLNFTLTDHFLINKFLITKKMFKNEYRYLEIDIKEVFSNSNVLFDIFEANMFYIEHFNAILIPAIVFLEPMFSLENPYYLSYATIGVFMAHELWHSIEHILHEYETTQKIYQNYSICLIDNYKKYIELKYGKTIDGSTTAEDQTADNFGILVALKTLLKIINNESMQNLNLLLPGLKYDQIQLFFMRYSQSFCRKTDKSLINFEREHSVHDYRVFQPSVTADFKKYFNCGNIQNKFSINECKLFD